MNKSWKPILLLVGIFLAGLVSGSLLTVHFGREWLSGRAAPEQWVTLHLKKLAERLELNPQQVEQIRPIVKRYCARKMYVIVPRCGSGELLEELKRALWAERKAFSRMQSSARVRPSSSSARLTRPSRSTATLITTAPWPMHR